MTLIEFIAFIFFMLLFVVLSIKTRLEKRKAHLAEELPQQKNLDQREYSFQEIEEESLQSEEEEDWDEEEDYYEKNHFETYSWNFETEDAEESPYSSNFTETGMALEMEEEVHPYAFIQPREPRIKKYFNRVDSYKDLVIYFEIYSAPKSLRSNWDSFEPL